MPPLFIYGSLRDPKIQQELFGRMLSGRSDVLKGYILSKFVIDGVTHKNIVPNPLGEVPGIIVDLSEEELRAADSYETSAYRREMVTLSSGERALAYIH